MAEQESIQTQLDCLRFDVVGLQQRELARDRDILEMVKGRETFVQDACKALAALQAIVNSQHQELHLLCDTVASLQQDVDLVAVSASKLVRHITRVEKELHLLRDTVASLQRDVATLEEKFSIMEEVTNVTVSLDETDEGGAERAEMEHELEEDVRASQPWERKADRHPSLAERRAEMKYHQLQREYGTGV